MIEIHEVVSPGAAQGHGAALSATLTYEQRVRTRLRARADSGEALAILLPRGTVLRDGDVLRATAGTHVVVRAAAERLSVVHAEDPLALARACYHLGNRHVAVQIAAGQARYQHDHVLDEMVRGLGLQVSVESAPFQPEPGAYGGHTHGHAGEHPHGHD